MDQSLAQAFVNFLETESKPKVMVKLPVAEMADSRNRKAQVRNMKGVVIISTTFLSVKCMKK